METKYMNNIVVNYNKDDWNKALSKKLTFVESGLIAISTMISIGLFVGCILLCNKIGIPNIGMMLGMLLMMLSMIFMIALIERYTYGRQITGFRFIDWFNIQDSIKANYGLSTVSLDAHRDREHTNIKMENLLKQFGCKYNIKFTDKYNMFDSTPIEVTVDATNKDLMLINVERARNN